LKGRTTIRELEQWMKNKLLVGCTVMVSVVLGYGQSAGPQRQPASAPGATAAPRAPETASTTPASGRALLDQYCVTCHNDRTKRANLSLEKLDLATHVAANPQFWEKVVRKLRAGVMPPPGMKRPELATYNGLTEWLETEIDRNAKMNPGSVGLHRMNRSEYANAVRDLLNLQIDPETLLPPDDSARGFDNVAGSLTISSTLLESYANAAGKVARMAVGYWKTPTERTYIAPTDTSQEYHIEGLPFGTRGGMVVDHVFPADGEYRFSIQDYVIGPYIGDEQLELGVDGEKVKLFDWNDLQVQPDSDGGQVQITVPVKAGTHKVEVTFVATNYRPSLDLAKHFARSTLENSRIAGFTNYPEVGLLKIQGPFSAQRPTDSRSISKVFTCHPATAAQEETCARQILTTLARRAYRRPTVPEDMESLMGFYQEGRKGGTFEDGIEIAVRRILASPQFLVRVEKEPAGLTAGQTYRINDIELASRLSFFLWSSIPDDELLNLAGQGKLSNPAVLEQQVKRMLADPKSDSLVKNFAAQWLYLRNLKAISPVATTYPDWDDQLRQGFRREAELLFQSVMREDRNVLDFMTANYTFVNDRLAKHYGIPNVYGSQFRRVTLPAELDYRRGLLGKGAFLAIASVPDRNSPVKRGVWILDNILGTPPPEPPPNVPPLEDTTGEPGKILSIREKQTMHRKNEPCASCHKLFDPMGFALEPFSTDGSFRTKDGGDGGVPIDAKVDLYDGQPVDGPSGLRNALMRYSPQFVRVVTEKLMTYGLGRGVEYYDMPVLRSIVRDASKNNYRFSSIVLGIVKSAPFQMRIKTEENAN
jgi:mono/diheme cytochrome c family protein